MQINIAQLNNEVNSAAIFSKAYDMDMDRITLLRELIAERFSGNQADFARAIKRSPAQINQWLTGHRNLGDSGARLIELALDLPIGYFDGRNKAVFDGKLDLYSAGTQKTPTRVAMQDRPPYKPTYSPAIEAVISLMLEMTEVGQGVVLGKAMDMRDAYPCVIERRKQPKL